MAIPAPPSRSHFAFSIGGSYRNIEGAKFSSGSQSGGLTLPFLATTPPGTPSNVGSATGLADRTYLDGFVNQDPGTTALGDTWNWGYDNASQLGSNQAGDGTLTYRGLAPNKLTNTTTSQQLPSGDWSPEDEGIAPIIRLDYAYDLKPDLSLGFSFEYSFLGFDGGNRSSDFTSQQTQTSTQVNFTDVYNTGALIIPLAPYAGTFNGPGPLIPNIPASRTFTDGPLLATDQVSFFNGITESLDVKLHTLTLGPTCATKLGKVGLSAGAGFALNIVKWNATHEETLFIQQGAAPSKIYQQFSENAGGTNFLPGMYLQAGVTVPLTEQLFFSTFGRYDWSQTLEEKIGPSSFTIDPSGWSLSCMLGTTF